jgi:type IV pilus assembly protein PilY1
MSGSMWRRASWTINGGVYDPNRTYYGYFEPDSMYSYTIQGFEIDPAGRFSGNLMNYACMSRIDVTRKVLTGGAGQPTNQLYKNKLEAEGGVYNGNLYGGYPTPNYSYTIGGLTYTYRFTKPSSGPDASRRGQIVIQRVHAHLGPDSIPTGTFNQIIIPPDQNKVYGVLRQICDKDFDGNFDQNAPRLALMFYNAPSSNNDNIEVAREFYQSEDDPDMEPFINTINLRDPDGWTPVGKSVLEAIHYIRYCKPHYGGYNYHGYNSKYDPYYTGQGASLTKVWCAKSFVIILGDGESNNDQVSVTTDIHLPTGPFPMRWLCDYDDDNHQYDYVTQNIGLDVHHCADDYAYYGHITDLRPTGEPACSLNGKQNVTFYSIMSYGTGAPLFQEIAKDGGFDDLNSDNIPQPNEYDKNNDGIPDHYYEAEDGYRLEQALLDIVADIAAKISSASGVAMLSVGTKAGGSTVQGQFYPRKKFNTGEVLDWIGTCQSLWLDPFGNLREDNDRDAILHLLNDLVVKLEWDPSEQDVMVTRYQDILGNGDSLVQVGPPVHIELLEPVWDAGYWLWQNHNPPSNREIFTLLGGVKTDFSMASSMLLSPYLGQGLTVQQADTIIRYIRGDDIDPNVLRSRTVGGFVWKLGDIINSGATLISHPIERYDFIYGDVSYARYYNHYRNRRQVVYVGANDGMLHAFNAGIAIRSADSPITPLELNPAGYDLGEELWGYIPYNLLPQLKWLRDPTYGQCHVYYVDLKPYITDARIFTDDPVHIDGWGTLLIGGMRLGGSELANDMDTCRSAYFAIDVTDPLNPMPMWEFTHPDLRYTMCYPTVVRVEDRWFLTFGSGPMSCGGDCPQRGKLFVIDLETGALLRTFDLLDDQSFVADIFACDWGIDYNVDRIYFGDCHWVDAPVKGWQGKIYRIQTHDQTDPNMWTMDMIMEMDEAITAEGSVATDEYNHLWVYFGTGRLYSDIDEIDPTRHSYVGFRDDTTHSTDPSLLLDVTNLNVDTLGLVQPGDMPFDSLILMVDQHLGWYRQFETDGERNLTSSLVLGGAVLFTTFVPSGDICEYGGSGNLYALFYRTGTAYTRAFLGDTLGNNRVMVSVGSGFPSEPALYVSADQTKVFIQVGGGIVSPETGIPGLPRGGVILWKGR